MKIDRIVLERKSTRMFNGLMPLSEVKDEMTSFLSTHWHASRRMAPRRVTIQKVDKCNFPSLTEGKKRAVTRKSKIVMQVMDKLRTIS